MERLTIQTLTDLNKALAAGMGANLHWFPEDVPLSRLAGTMVGMANTSGGTILLGIAPRSGEAIGMMDPEGEADRVFQAALMCDPPLVLPMPLRIALIRPNDSTPPVVLCVTVPSGLPYVYSLDGRYLWREGSQTNPLPARRLRQLLIDRGVVQFEAGTVDSATIDDLDAGLVSAYLEKLHLPAETDPAQVLSRRGCLISVEGRLRPTIAGLLLFGRFPQQWLPGALILAARFPGVAPSDQFIKQEIRGALPEQLRQAEAFVRSNLRSTARLVGLERTERLEYPFEAVRELLVNAIAHRDYRIQGDTIHLHLFADRIEVHSPGELPGPVNLSNLLEARFSRNAVISQVLYDLGFVERLGYGLNRVVQVMRENNLRPPQFQETAGTFRVTLYNSLLNNLSLDVEAALSLDPDLELNPRQRMVMNELLHHRRITSHTYQELCPGVHAETLRRDLADLVKRGLLIKIGDKRATYYILKKTPAS